MLLALQLLNLLEEADAGPGFDAVASVGGTAVDADGVMGVTFLDDSTSVPAGAVFLNGFAHDNDGMRYVALWPASEAVVYNRGYATRHDGAMIIDPSGTPAAYLNGWALTTRGEVIGTTSAPQLIKNGIGQLNSASVCMSEVA
jgi:hypothetical protein